MDVTVGPPLVKLSSSKTFEGELTKYKFKARTCRFSNTHRLNASQMQSAALGGLYANFNLFLPPDSTKHKVPILTWLAGLTCTEDNGYISLFPSILIVDFSYSAQKGSFFREAALQGIAILFPDTSPRGAGIEGEDADWDFGTGLPRACHAFKSSSSRFLSKVPVFT
jgi:S-formylglutathione hydrolase FrmB